MTSWFKKEDPKVQQRATDRAVRKTNRDLESDRRQLERKEKELEMEIRKLAKAGQREACARLAKQLIQLRNQRSKSMGMSAQVTAVGAQARSMQSMGKMASAVGESAKTMQAVNKQLPIEKMAAQMRDFEQANTEMGMKEEIVNETLDAMLDESGDEEEQDAIIERVLDEIGIDLKAQLSKAPRAPASSMATSHKQPMSDAEIESMLTNLRS